MAYERINWQNGEVGNTPLNANNLNRMDMAIEEHDQKIGDHDYEIENLKTGAQGITEELNKKMDRINPQGSGTFSIQAVNADNITAQVVEADEIKVTKVSSKGGTAPVAFDNDILVNGITTPIGSLAASASAKAESASERAENAYNLASRANREAASAINKANDNKVKIDLHTGLIGEGVGDKVPIPSYTDGYYIAPDGRVTQYNATATLIKIEFLDFFFRGDNIIFNHVDLLPTENCIPCAWYDISGNFISAADGLNIIAEFDEQTSKITKQYIDYCIISVPAGASSCKLSGLANGRADIRIQTSLSEAIKDLQSKPEPSPLVLTNPSPLPTTDGKKIIGIDAKGKSEQKTTQTLATVQGNMPTVEVGSAINQTLGTSTTRCVSNIVRLGNGSVLSVTSGFEMYVLYAESENGNIVTANGWLTSRTVTADGFYRIQIRKADNSAITPTSFTLTASSTPTPTNPIPIIDASEEVSAIGKNLFDATDYTLANIGADGTVTPNNTVRCSDYIKVDRDFVLSYNNIASASDTNFRVAFYDENKTFIKRWFVTNNGRHSYKSSDMCSQKFGYIRCAYDGIMDNYTEVQIELGTTATSYIPYASNTITLPFSPKSVGSVANELIVNEDGSAKIVKRVKTLDLGTLNGWTKATYHYWIGIAESNFDAKKVSASAKMNALCDAYSVIINNDVRNTNNAIGLSYDAGVYYFGIRNDAITSASELVESLRGVTFQYELATPIETPLTASEVASIRQLQTYKGTTIIESEMQIESVTYSGDVKGYVDSKTDYSYTDTIIGKWADGKDLHRMVIQTTTPSGTNMAVVFPLLKSGDVDVKNFGGTVYASSSAKIPINIYINSTNSCSCWIDTNGIYMTSTYSSKACEIIVEYTLKDSAPAAASVLSLDETEE